MKLTLKNTNQTFDIDPASANVRLDHERAFIRTAFLRGKRVEFGWFGHDNKITVILDGISYDFEVEDPRRRKTETRLLKQAAVRRTCEVRAPIPGLVTSVHVKTGERVKRDQPLCTLDAMKLENEIASPIDGRIRSIQVKAGIPVEKDRVLMVIEP